MKNLVLVQILCSIALLTGCATAPKFSEQKIALGADAKVGVIFLIDNHATHAHTGTTIFQNKTRKIKQDWQIKTEALKYAQALLGHKATVVEITPSYTLKNLDALVNTGWSSFPLKDVTKTELNKLAKEHDLDAHILIRGRNEGKFGDNGQFTPGYGVFTECRFGMCTAFYLDNIFASISSAPAQEHFVSWGRDYAPMREKIVEFDFSKDLKNIGAHDLSKFRTEVIKSLQRDLKDAITGSGML